MTMRILYVWDAEYPWDVRTEKVCLALTAAGHEVVITGRNLQDRPRTERLPEGTVERLAAGFGPARRWLSFPAFFNPFWLGHLTSLIRRHRIDLVMVRDLPLAPTALMAARRRMPVVLDMAENYPAMIRDIWTDGRQKPLDILVRNPSLVAGVERYVLRRVDHVVTVVEESKDRVVALGVPADRVSVVSNTPPASRAAADSAERPSTGPIRMVYLGLMEKHRGIGCTLGAAAILKHSGFPFHLDLVGDGRDYDHFREQARQLDLTDAEVVFHGRLPHQQAIEVVAGAHVGLVPHEARESWNTTIPNKLFDYMAAGLAVVSSDAAPATRVIQETGAGVVFRSNDASDLAAAIRKSAADWAGFGRAGKAAIASRYNWETDTRALLEVVSSLRQSPNGGAGT